MEAVPLTATEAASLADPYAAGMDQAAGTRLGGAVAGAGETP